MNANQNIHDILKESIELLKDTENLTNGHADAEGHGCIYHDTYDQDELVGEIAFKEVDCGGVLPGILVNDQITCFSIVLFDPELLNAYDEAQKALSTTK